MHKPTKTLFAKVRRAAVALAAALLTMAGAQAQNAPATGVTPAPLPADRATRIDPKQQYVLAQFNYRVRQTWDIDVARAARTREMYQKNSPTTEMIGWLVLATPTIPTRQYPEQAVFTFRGKTFDLMKDGVNAFGAKKVKDTTWNRDAWFITSSYEEEKRLGQTPIQYVAQVLGTPIIPIKAEEATPANRIVTPPLTSQEREVFHKGNQLYFTREDGTHYEQKVKNPLVYETLKGLGLIFDGIDPIAPLSYPQRLVEAAAKIDEHTTVGTEGPGPGSGFNSVEVMRGGAKSACAGLLGVFQDVALVRGDLGDALDGICTKVGDRSPHSRGLILGPDGYLVESDWNGQEPLARGESIYREAVNTPAVFTSIARIQIASLQQEGQLTPKDGGGVLVYQVFVNKVQDVGVFKKGIPFVVTVSYKTGSGAVLARNIDLRPLFK